MENSIPRFEVMDDVMAEVMRAKSERERLEIAFGMWEFAREMIRANIEKEHSDWSTTRIQRLVAERMSHESG